MGELWTELGAERLWGNAGAAGEANGCGGGGGLLAAEGGGGGRGAGTLDAGGGGGGAPPAAMKVGGHAEGHGQQGMQNIRGRKREREKEREKERERVFKQTQIPAAQPDLGEESLHQSQQGDESGEMCQNNERDPNSNWHETP
jgi:hypothetical protein